MISQKNKSIKVCRIIASAALIGWIGCALSSRAAAHNGSQSSGTTRTGNQTVPWKIEIGRPIERLLSGGETHSYQIALTADQYLHIVVNQRGIDVVVTMLDPDGRHLTEVDSPNGTQGPEPVRLVSESAGVYTLVVGSLEKAAPSGK